MSVVLQVSLKNSLNIAEHLCLGEVLQPLRREGVLIIGSGSTTHRFDVSDSDRRSFMEWFHDVMTSKTVSPEKRKQLLLDSRTEPKFAAGHGRIEHFLPSVVACAAAGYQPGAVLFEDFWMSHIKFD